MVWVRIDDAISEHPKIASIDDTAFALFVAGLAYCNRNLTDGHIPSAVGYGQLRWADGNTVPAIQQLEKVGLWEQSDKGGWQVHDYLDYQPSRAQVEAEREASRERKARSRQESQGVSHQESHKESGRTPLGGPGTGTGSGVDVVEGGSGGEPFKRFWSIYPRRVGKRAARAAFEGALKRAPADEIIAGAERYRDDPNREDSFTAHPTTWLNQDRWTDDPLPSRNGSDRASQIYRESEKLRTQREGVSRGTRPGIGPGGPAAGGLPN